MSRLIAWFAYNPVAANLLMLLLFFWGGYAVVRQIPLEVFPNSVRDEVVVEVGYRGATPEEVEIGLATKIEEAIYDLEGVKTLTSRSREGGVVVVAEVASGYDKQILLAEIKNRVDGVSLLPDDADQPIIGLSIRRREVISVVVSGEQPEKALRQLGEQVRDELRALPEVSQVFLESVRPYEISIEVSELALNQYQLSLSQIAVAIKQSSLILGGGSLKTRAGEIIIKTRQQAETLQDFAAIVVKSQADGRQLRLGDVAQIQDGFEEQAIKVRFNGQPAVLIEVYRVGNQSAIKVANAVKAYLEQIQAGLPTGVQVAYWRDWSRIVKARLHTLLMSGLQGGVLVLLLLALFLRPALAFWVCVGIPISFMGGLAFLPFFGVSLNIFSLFAFILVLGIVVDDAIVTGENIYARLQRGEEPLIAAVKGTQEVSVPVTFGILTTMAAFAPLLLVDGRRALFFTQIPLVVIPVLFYSLVESKLILPAHLRHLKVLPKKVAEQGWLTRWQQFFAQSLERFVVKVYQPSLRYCLAQRYAVLALFIGGCLIIVACIDSGRTRFVFFPRVQSELARAYITFPVGTDFSITDQAVAKVTQAARFLQAEYVDEAGKSVIKNILSTTAHSGGQGGARSHVGRVMFEVVSPEVRTVEVTSTELVQAWRRLIGVIPGVESLTFRSEIGRGGDPIDIRFSGQSFDQLRAVADQVKEKLTDFPTVFGISDSMAAGRQEMGLTLRPAAELLGLSLGEVTRQVRDAFFGIEAQRIQRGRDDIRVMVRYPATERDAYDHLENFLLRLPTGERIPLYQLVKLVPGTGPNLITRIDRDRVISVTADVNKATANMGAIKREMEGYLRDLLPQYPGIQFTMGGEAEEQAESFAGLKWGLLGALLLIYALLAIPLASYLQPLIVMSVMPFGLCGAVIGHWVMGMDLTILSLMGMLALVGVVVNDSLVLVDYINRHRRADLKRSLVVAVQRAGMVRFRPVLLTSLTTFAGLMPLIFEKSTQAQFLIPMAVSLGFGILFATLITLVLVPVVYLVLEDVRAKFSLESNS